MRVRHTLMVGLYLPAIGQEVNASQHTWRLSADELVSVFASEVDSVPTGMAWQTIASEIRQPRNAVRTDSILHALLPLARDNTRVRVQQEAIGLLGWGASYDNPTPRAWVAQALAALYWNLDQARPVARATALDVFAQFADTALGHGMLRRVLTEAAVPRREREAAARAALTSPRSQALLRELDRTGAIPDSWVRAWVKTWLEQRAGPRPPV